MNTIKNVYAYNDEVPGEPTCFEVQGTVTEMLNLRCGFHQHWSPQRSFNLRVIIMSLKFNKLWQQQC